MSLQRAAFTLALAGGLALACSSGDPQIDEGDRICAPGTNVVCKCANLETGTKLCNDEGSGYSTPCSVNGSEECPGGEIPDPGSSSGKPSSSSGGGTDRNVCPGQLVAVPAGAPIEVSGSTRGSEDSAKGTGSCAAGEGAADHVYRVVPAARGALEVKIQSEDSGYAPVVYLRRGACEETGAQVGCVAAGANQGAQLTANVVENEPYWLVVDGAAGPEGDGQYKLTFTLTEGAFCGDTVADPGEVCDDGNNVDGDGCSADCTNFSGNPPSAVQCPGQPIHLWLDGEARGSGSTAATALIGARNTFDTVSQACFYGGAGTNSANEHVYDLVAHGTGELLVTLSNATFDARMTSWTACDPAAEHYAECGQPEDAGATTFALPVVTLQDGAHYTLVVDGNASSGNYDLELLYLGP